MIEEIKEALESLALFILVVVPFVGVIYNLYCAIKNE